MTNPKTCEETADDLASALFAERAKNAKLLRILEPFAQDDLCRLLSGNIEGNSSIIFQRDDAILRLRDFRRARAAIEGSEK